MLTKKTDKIRFVIAKYMIDWGVVLGVQPVHTYRLVKCFNLLKTADCYL